MNTIDSQAKQVWASPPTFYGYYYVYEYEDEFFACHNDRRFTQNVKDMATAVQACQDDIDSIVAKYGYPMEQTE